MDAIHFICVDFRSVLVLLGSTIFKLELLKELHPDMVATYSSSAHVFLGHPFIVEASVSIGRKDVKQETAVVKTAGKA
ncbi:DNA topoisomerase 6 subunit B-like [Benincasa hispida]|uniref:DNA topoisomerase 6 subunit B-like n=1 Tax=Benincasa hispida TaxID=102211 RepID=UPI0019013E63|nr:DNA topoisomerase 6 subunit B-like [Benincasa hispida]